MKDHNDASTADSATTAKLVVSWLFVGIPLLWGVSITLANAAKLFH